MNKVQKIVAVTAISLGLILSGNPPPIRVSADVTPTVEESTGWYEQTKVVNGTTYYRAARSADLPEEGWYAPRQSSGSGTSNGASYNTHTNIGYVKTCIKGSINELDNGWVTAATNNTTIVRYDFISESHTSVTPPGQSSAQSYNTDSYSYYYLTLNGLTSVPVVQLPAPSILLTATDTTKIQVKMSSVANASSYTLQYSTNSSFSSSSTKTMSPGTTTITGLTPNTKYYFRVKANTTSSSYTASDYCAAESCATLKTALPTPLVVTASAQDATTIKIEYQTTPF